MKKLSLLVFLLLLKLGIFGLEIPSFELHKGLVNFNSWAETVNFLDINNDNYPDLLVGGNSLYVNRSQGGKIVFEKCDLPNLRGSSAVAFDFNNDGWTDFATSGGNLMQNNGDGTFADVANQCKFTPHVKSGSMAVGDLDNDGFADVIIGMLEDWNGANSAYYPLQVFMNRGGKYFEEVAEKLKINSSKYSRSLIIYDFDGNGFQDIYVGNYRLQPNYLWMNYGDNKFIDEAEKRGVQGKFEPNRFYDEVQKCRYGYRYGHTLGCLIFDWNNDGNMDLWVSNLAHKYIGFRKKDPTQYDVRGYYCDDSAIYCNNGDGYFRDCRGDLGLMPEPIGVARDELWSSVIASDINNDSYEDVFVPQIYSLPYSNAKIFLNDMGRKFVDISDKIEAKIFDSYCGAWADIDCDGDMDLITFGRLESNRGGEIYCLLNNSKVLKNSYRKVILRSSATQTAVGAVVKLIDKESIQTRFFGSYGSYRNQQNDPALHFACPQGVENCEVTIKWASGVVEKYQLKDNCTVIYAPPKKQ
ncbi:MAG: CRTAC1 family protein [Lentisphaeria bacterium]|nr:CRTAC1 family protein [Lentisphaeria bacterium]